ncbi:MAG: SpoIIE family protein phosphatase [bacterium]
MRAGTVHAPAGGMGDCILMDFHKGFFAVSDGASRNPAASYHFLSRFAEGLDRIRPLDPGIFLSPAAFRSARDEFLAQAGATLEQIPYTESCTFTGLLIARTRRQGARGILLHTGDSLLFQVDARPGSCRQLTTNNFWMVGRSKRYFQIDEIDLPDESVFILATDGISDLGSEGNATTSESIARLSARHPIEGVADEIVESIDLHTPRTDDIGVVVLRPDRLLSAPARFLVGGTGGEEETVYRERCRDGTYEDRYLPAPGAACSGGPSQTGRDDED